MYRIGIPIERSLRKAMVRYLNDRGEATWSRNRTRRPIGSESDETARWDRMDREFDKLAKAYYFHRFYSYQPDLNTGNPTVRDEIKKIMGFWLALGVSGFRVDAALS